MLKVGLTGGIGSGKTLVCSILEKLGVPVYYADKEARRLMNEDSELAVQISGLFGKEAYEDGSLNRKFLASKVFNDSESLARLNKLVHPAVGQDFTTWSIKQTNAPYLVKEAAILFESGSDRNMDLTVGIFADKETRVRRVMVRDGLAREEVLNRMSKQMDEEEKKKRVDYLIHNDGEELLIPQVINVHKEILKRG